MASYRHENSLLVFIVCLLPENAFVFVRRRFVKNNSRDNYKFSFFCNFFVIQQIFRLFSPSERHNFVELDLKLPG